MTGENSVVIAVNNVMYYKSVLAVTGILQLDTRLFYWYRLQVSRRDPFGSLFANQYGNKIIYGPAV